MEGKNPTAFLNYSHEQILFIFQRQLSRAQARYLAKTRPSPQPYDYHSNLRNDLWSISRTSRF